MKTLLTAVLLIAGLSAAGVEAQAQAAKSSKASAQHKTASTAGRTECVLSVGLCVTVPANWQRLGDVFGDLGFVVAEQHVGTDSATWPQLTVAAIDVPQKDKSGNTPSLDSLVDLVLAPGNPSTTSETLQRSRTMLNGHNAEIVRVKLHDNASQAESIEEIALIEGDDALVYSIALRCAPDDATRLEAIFQKAAHSWHVRQAVAKPRPAPEAQPKQDSDKTDSDKK